MILWIVLVEHEIPERIYVAFWPKSFIERDILLRTGKGSALAGEFQPNLGLRSNCATEPLREVGTFALRTGRSVDNSDVVISKDNSEGECGLAV